MQPRFGSPIPARAPRQQAPRSWPRRFLSDYPRGDHSRMSVLDYMCTACCRIGEIDLRQVDRHPTLPFRVQELSCRSCRPNPPFTKLVRLKSRSAQSARRNFVRGEPERHCCVFQGLAAQAQGHIVLIVLKAVCSRFTERSLAWAGYWNLYSCSGRFWYWSVLPCADGLVLDSRNVPGSCRLTFIIGSDPKVSVAERPVVLPRQPKRRATCLSLAFLLHQRASRHICLARCVMT